MGVGVLIYIYIDQRLQPVCLQCKKDLGLQSQMVLVVQHLVSVDLRRSSFPSPVSSPWRLVFRRMIDKEITAKHSLWQQVNIGTVPEIEVKMGQGEMVYRCTFAGKKDFQALLSKTNLLSAKILSGGVLSAMRVGFNLCHTGALWRKMEKVSPHKWGLEGVVYLYICISHKQHSISLSHVWRGPSHHIAFATKGPAKPIPWWSTSKSQDEGRIGMGLDGSGLADLRGSSSEGWPRHCFISHTNFQDHVIQ